MSYTPKKCSFCSRTIALGNGIMYIRNDGVTFWYCSSKCRKNSLELKRDPRKLKWARSVGRQAAQQRNKPRAQRSSATATAPTPVSIKK